MASATTVLHPGDTLGGFRIDDVIGIGGMAIVYRAEQVSLGRPVALKVLSSRLTSDTVFRERFRREGTHAAALEHPNIVPVYDSGEQDGHLFLAMRLVDGTNLAELIQTRGLTADQTIEILRPIASALDTAHAAGLIHRDVKPQNILITSQNHPYLADFGVSKGSNTYGLTATGGFVGSINYASPEQIKGLTLTPASDVYALTAVLYHCLTGHVPYERDTDAGIMHAHLHEPPPSFPTLDGANSDFHTVLARGMAKDPGARYGHAGDLLNAAGLSVSRLPAASRKRVPAFPTNAATSTPDLHASAAGAADDVSPPAIHPIMELTAADVRREPPEPEPVPARPSRRRPYLIAAGALTCAAIAAVALVLSSGGATPSRYRSGHLVLTAGREWHGGAPPLEALHIANPVSISRSSVQVSAGGVSGPAGVPAAAPSSLLSAYGPPSRTSLVTLPLGRARRYVWTQSHTPLALVSIATDAGELAIACRASSAALRSSVLSACNTLATTARVIGTQVDYPGADPQVDTLLRRSLAARVQLATTATAALRATSLPARARVLTQLATADARAAQTLAQASIAARYRGPVGVLTGALHREEAWLREATIAARTGDRPLYSSLRARASEVGQAMRGSLDGLRSLGFTVGLPILALPAAPAGRARKVQAPATPQPTGSQPEPPITPATSPGGTATPAPPLPAPPESRHVERARSVKSKAE